MSLLRPNPGEHARNSVRLDLTLNIPNLFLSHRLLTRPSPSTLSSLLFPRSRRNHDTARAFFSVSPTTSACSGHVQHLRAVFRFLLVCPDPGLGFGSHSASCLSPSLLKALCPRRHGWSPASRQPRLHELHLQALSERGQPGQLARGRGEQVQAVRRERPQARGLHQAFLRLLAREPDCLPYRRLLQDQVAPVWLRRGMCACARDTFMSHPVVQDPTLTHS